MSSQDREPCAMIGRISAGALGAGLPPRDHLVSRQHQKLVRSQIVKRVFAVQDVFVPAIKLTDLPNIFVDDTIRSVTYFHMLFDQHEVIFAEGAPTESLLTGPDALRALGSEARDDILTLFPEVTEVDHVPVPARRIPPDELQKQLIERHLKIHKPSVE
ncbi:Hint domain-containing protein [Aliiroseovarius sp. S1339]|uniref:Hint domain-containing protein n=1 Tax=Aliiroseovarius sp. S1339 TaxID=2936990 RepID=UPI0020BE39D2|nr:Hint domain-containing protein [Aliiroseovarius sp. S1339]MCK8464021.1 Hint domain-containing protein [Aliiroseovarius sp. S1339]